MAPIGCSAAAPTAAPVLQAPCAVSRCSSSTALASSRNLCAVNFGFEGIRLAIDVDRIGKLVRRPSKVSCCGASGGLLDLYNKPNFGSKTTSTYDLHKSRTVRARAGVEDGVKTTEAASSDETRTSTSTSDPPTLDSPPPSTSNPFAGGKISRIAAKQTDSKPSASASVAQKPATPKKPATVKPPVVGQLSANAAAQLNVTRQPSVFTVPTKPTDGEPSSPFSQSGPSSSPSSPFAQPRPSKPTAPTNPFRKAPLVPTDWEKAGARPAGSGKRVLEAFKEGEKENKSTTKFGLPVVPTNIFDEVRRTPEEIAADAFKFEINSGQLLLASSFLVVIAIMFGTVFLVWKVGAIHYNEL